MKKNIIILIIVLLLICFIIIAALIGLSTAGVNTVQQSSRDTDRRATLNEIDMQISAFYADTGTYPSSITITGSRDSVNISNDKVVKLQKATIALPVSATNSTDKGSKYCYYVSGNDYVVGVMLEATGAYATRGNLPASSCANYPL